MSKIYDKKVSGLIKGLYPIHIEQFEGGMEVVAVNNNRNKIALGGFYDVRKKRYSSSFEAVASFKEANDLLAGGYQPTVDAMRGVFKASRKGEGTRFSFQNSVQGFAPVVPLALKNVPNSMISMTMKPIKAKVIDIYYDMTIGCFVDSKDIIKAGQTMLGVIVEMERQGYRFNLYACQTYADREDCDMLVVKVKNASQPVDLKRISFPLTHPAFFRVIGFDWYSRVPGGKYRSGYGHAMAYDFSKEKLGFMATQLFGKNAIWFSSKELMGQGEEYIREVVSNGNSKA